MAIIIDGKKISDEIIENLKKESLKPTLAVIQAGNNPASEVYVKNKIKRAKEAGFESVLVKLDENVTKEELLFHIKKLNDDANINGILLQLPLPKGLNEADFLDKISPIKDVDGFSSYNTGKLTKGETPFAIACTPKGIMTLLYKTGVQIEGKIAVVIGRSNIVGKPVASLLLKNNATVIQAHSKTKNLEELTKMADILIVAIGKPRFIKKDMIKEGAIIIDVGINRDDAGKLAGDVDFDDVFNKAGYITPVPGGVGPMTIASLLENCFNLALIQKAGK